MNLQDLKAALNKIVNDHYRRQSITLGEARYFDKDYIPDDLLTRENARAAYQLLKKYFTPFNKGGEE